MSLPAVPLELSDVFVMMDDVASSLRRAAEDAVGRPAHRVEVRLREHGLGRFRCHFRPARGTVGRLVQSVPFTIEFELGRVLEQLGHDLLASAGAADRLQVKDIILTGTGRVARFQVLFGARRRTARSAGIERDDGPREDRTATRQQ